MDKNPYRHDRHADKNPYGHDRRADKNPYRHDRHADSQCQHFLLKCRALTVTRGPFMEKTIIMFIE